MHEITKEVYSKPVCKILQIDSECAFLAFSYGIKATVSTEDVQSDWKEHLKMDYYTWDFDDDGIVDEKIPKYNPFFEGGGEGVEDF